MYSISCMHNFFFKVDSTYSQYIHVHMGIAIKCYYILDLQKCTISIVAPHKACILWYLISCGVSFLLLAIAHTACTTSDNVTNSITQNA